jgi:2'-5' RNA ligase
VAARAAAAREPLHRLFFALLPPAIVADQIDLECRRQTFVGGRIRKDRLHLTLDMIDDMEAAPPAMLVDEMKAVAGAISVAAFDFHLTRSTSWNGTSALAPTGTAALKELHAQLAAMRQGRKTPTRRGWNFNPHVTLGYGPIAPRVGPIRPIHWHAGELVLIHSLVGTTEHIPLGR